MVDRTGISGIGNTRPIGRNEGSIPSAQLFFAHLPRAEGARRDDHTHTVPDRATLPVGVSIEGTR